MGLGYDIVWVKHKDGSVDHPLTRGEWEHELATLKESVIESGLTPEKLAEYQGLDDDACDDWLRDNIPDFEQAMARCDDVMRSAVLYEDLDGWTVDEGLYD